MRPSGSRGDDYDILLIGHDGHEEVIGTSGEAPEHVQLVDGPDDVANVTVRDPEKVVWLSQTTLSVDETTATVEALRARFPKLIDPPSDDICYATQNRQVAVKDIAAQSELVIVVGSQNSSNSKRLVEVAKDHGADASHLVDYADQIDPSWLEGVTTVGVTSGASVPEELVAEVLGRLAEHGFDTVEEVESVREHMIFSLPQGTAPRPAYGLTGLDSRDRPQPVWAPGVSSQRTGSSSSPFSLRPRNDVRPRKGLSAAIPALSSRRLAGRPRGTAMTTTSTAPVNSHGMLEVSVVIRVSSTLSVNDRSPSDPVTAASSDTRK